MAVACVCVCVCVCVAVAVCVCVCVCVWLWLWLCVCVCVCVCATVNLSHVLSATSCLCWGHRSVLGAIKSRWCVQSCVQDSLSPTAVCCISEPHFKHFKYIHEHFIFGENIHTSFTYTTTLGIFLRNSCIYAAF